MDVIVRYYKVLYRIYIERNKRIEIEPEIQFIAGKLTFNSV